ncbi:MAG TPA: hypothetical protein VFD52_05530 [Clostridia bacterium]|nr:hypothetical protein [Clostridia bacterium]
MILPLRVYQYMRIIEGGTGFYSKMDASIPIMYVLLFAVCFVPIIISLSMRKGLETISCPKAVRFGEGIAALLVAVTLIINAVETFGGFSDIFYAFKTINYDYTLSKYLMKSGGFAVLLESIFAVVSMVFFILLGGAHFKGTSVSEYKLLAIAPLAWSICRIIHRFMRPVSYLKVSDLFFEMLMIVFLMLFFLAMAQKTSGVNSAGKGWKVFGYGLPAATLSLLCFVPRLTVAVMGRSDLLADKSPIEYCDMAIALFIITYTIGRFQDIRAQVARPKLEELKAESDPAEENS